MYLVFCQLRETYTFKKSKFNGKTYFEMYLVSCQLRETYTFENPATLLTVVKKNIEWIEHIPYLNPLKPRPFFFVIWMIPSVCWAFRPPEKSFILKFHEIREFNRVTSLSRKCLAGVCGSDGTSKAKGNTIVVQAYQMLCMEYISVSLCLL
jgi:hypothetical protein